MNSSTAARDRVTGRTEAANMTSLRRLPTWAIAAFVTFAVVASLMIGYGVGRALSENTSAAPAAATPGDNSPEAGFARDMSTHHAQAVEMGMIAAKNASLSEVRTLGADIALTQQAQIGMMQTWLEDWQLLPTGSKPQMAWMPEGTTALKDGLMPGLATEAEMQKLREAKGKQADIVFVQLILKHHLGGIHMAEGVIALSHNEQVLKLAQGMKLAQQREVTLCQDLLKQLGATP